MSLLYKVSHYHGSKKTNNFFEGWYFKAYDEARGRVIAIVPGIFRSSKATPEESHAFIFVNEGGVKQHYYRFPCSDFVADKEKFRVVIAGVNEFTQDALTVDLKPKEGDDASISLKGSLKFGANTPWPITRASPGVMGPVAFMPFVECTHGVLSFDSSVEGTLQVDDVACDYTGGRAYIEKDFGRKFPKAWVWLQTNAFPKIEGPNQPSLFFSAAFVPYAGMSFPGFICGFLDGKGKLHRFTLYLMSKFYNFAVDEENKTLEFELRNSSHVLYITASYDIPMVTLYGPEGNKMALSVPEGLTGKIHVKLRRKKAEAFEFDAEGTCAGMEVQGDVQKLSKSLCRK